MVCTGPAARIPAQAQNPPTRLFGTRGVRATANRVRLSRASFPFAGRNELSPSVPSARAGRRLQEPQTPADETAPAVTTGAVGKKRLGTMKPIPRSRSAIPTTIPKRPSRSAMYDVFSAVVARGQSGRAVRRRSRAVLPMSACVRFRRSRLTVQLPAFVVADRSRRTFGCVSATATTAALSEVATAPRADEAPPAIVA